MPATEFMTHIQDFILDFHDPAIAHTLLRQQFQINVASDMLIDSDGEAFPVYLYNRGTTIKRFDKGVFQAEDEANRLMLSDSGQFISRGLPKMRKKSQIKSSDIQWDVCRAEKLYKGEEVVVFTHMGQTFIQTSSTSASGTVLDPAWVKTHELLGGNQQGIYERLKDLPRLEDYILIFELIGPEFSITPYSKDELVLVAVYNKISGMDLLASYVDNIAGYCDFKRPAFIEVKNFGEVESFIKRLNPFDVGAVLNDSHGTRVKYRNPLFDKLAQVDREDVILSARTLAKIALTGHSQRVAHKCGRYQRDILFLNKILYDIACDTELLWDLYSKEVAKKSFAYKIKSFPVEWLLFAIRKGAINNYEDMLAHITPKQLIRAAKDRLKSNVFPAGSYKYISEENHVNGHEKTYQMV